MGPVLGLALVGSKPRRGLVLSSALTDALVLALAGRRSNVMAQELQLDLKINSWLLDKTPAVHMAQQVQ